MLLLSPIRTNSNNLLNNSKDFLPLLKILWWEELVSDLDLIVDNNNSNSNLQVDLGNNLSLLTLWDSLNNKEDLTSNKIIILANNHLKVSIVNINRVLWWCSIKIMVIKWVVMDKGLIIIIIVVIKWAVMDKDNFNSSSNNSLGFNRVILGEVSILRTIRICI